MSKKNKDSWSVASLCNKIENGQVTFDNVCQRNVVWDSNRKSLLIQTLCEDLFIPPIFCNLKTDVYDAIDGKQRSYALFTYLQDGFALGKLTPDTTLDNGQPYELAGKRFSDLPAELQNRVKDYMIDIFYMENMSSEQIIETLFRLNNAKQMSSIELSRIRACSLEKFKCLLNMSCSNLCKKMPLIDIKTRRLLSRHGHSSSRQILLLMQNISDF